jgi:hypothetical protein
MQDKLEKFIKENREEFDFHIPDPQIWNRIEKQLDAKKEKGRVWLLATRMAAAIVTILAVGILIGIQISRRDVHQINYALSPVLKSYQETEQYYQQQVNLKLEEVKALQPESNIEQDLKQLDEVYNELKEELIRSNYSNSEVMINAMIKNHKTKVEILESILEKQKQNKLKNENENISI